MRGRRGTTDVYALDVNRAMIGFNIDLGLRWCTLRDLCFIDRSVLSGFHLLVHLKEESQKGVNSSSFSDETQKTVCSDAARVVRGRSIRIKRIYVQEQICFIRRILYRLTRHVVSHVPYAVFRLVSLVVIAWSIFFGHVEYEERYLNHHPHKTVCLVCGKSSHPVYFVYLEIRY